MIGPQNGGVSFAAPQGSDLLVFEDRKFADIGGISHQTDGRCLQYSPMGRSGYGSLDFKDPDIVDGLQAGDDAVDTIVLLLAQMSNRGNLLLPDYTSQVVEKALNIPECLGLLA